MLREQQGPRGSSRRGVADVEDEPYQADADFGAGCVQDGLRHDIQIDGDVHDGEEEFFLAAEAVVHQCLINRGTRGDGADGGSVVALVGKRFPGGDEDRFAGVGSAGATSPTSCHESLSFVCLLADGWGDFRGQESIESLTMCGGMPPKSTRPTKRSMPSIVSVRGRARRMS